MEEKAEGAGVCIIGYDPRFASDFARLNYRWIEQFFAVERHDRELLEAPDEQIVAKGGEVFFALVGEEVAGTVAMVRNSAGVYELTKMAVDPVFQGRGIANLLMRACIGFARERGAKTIFLETNSILPVAIRLYKKFGFRETKLDPASQYTRANVRMELAIADAEM